MLGANPSSRAAATSRMVTRRELGSCGDKPLLHHSLVRHPASAPERWVVTGLDAVSRASYLTEENLFLSQFGPTASPADNAPPARQYPYGSGTTNAGPVAIPHYPEPARPPQGARSTATKTRAHGNGPRPPRRPATAIQPQAITAHTLAPGLVVRGASCDIRG